MLLKAFQSLLTSPEFVQNLKAASSLIMGCLLAHETAPPCIQIRHKRMHRWTKRKTLPTSTLKTDAKLLAIKLIFNSNSFGTRLIEFSDFRMTSLTRTCALTWTFLIPSSVVVTSLHSPSKSPWKYIRWMRWFYVSATFCTLWVQRERVGEGGRAVSSDILDGRGLQTNRIESLLITTMELNSKFQTPNSFKASLKNPRTS